MTASLQIKYNKKGERFYYAVLRFKDINGKWQSKWISTGFTVSGNNKRKAEKKCQELLREWENKIGDNYESILFADFLLRWLEQTKSSIAETTYYSYKQAITSSIYPYFKKKKIELCELKPYHVQDFYNQKINDGLSANTVLHFHAYIHKCLEYAVKMDLIPVNVSDKVTLPKKEKHYADCYTVDELRLLLDNCKGSTIEPVIILAAHFGLRRGEIIGLKWRYVDFQNRIISIMGVMTDKGSGSRIENTKYRESAKTSSSIRSFPMPNSIYQYLLELKRKQEENQKQASYNMNYSEFVCVRSNGDLIPLDYVTREFPKLLERCGMRRIKLHELRHTNISLLIESGVSMKEAQEWAGHSDYSITANTYSHVSAQSKIKLSQSISKMLSE